MSGIDSSATTTLRRIYKIGQERGYTIICTGLSEAVRRQFVLQHLPVASDGDFVSIVTEAEALERVEEALLEASPGIVGKHEQVSLAGLMRDVLGRDVPDEGFMSTFTTRHFASGEILVREGDPPSMMVFIRHGRVSIEVQGPSGASLPVAAADPGVVIGELGFYTGDPCSATVRARTDTLGVLITRTDLDRMAREAPELAALFHDFMMRLLARKLVIHTQQRSRAQG